MDTENLKKRLDANYDGTDATAGLVRGDAQEVIQ